MHDLAEPLDWLPDASFDIVILALTLHYVDDRVAMLRELRRVLVPEGALVVSTTQPLADWQRLGGSYFAVEPVRGSLVSQHDWPARTWRRPLTQICQEFERAGFLIERLLEPRPVKEMAARDPESYARVFGGRAPAAAGVLLPGGLVNTAPVFIAFRLRPTPSPFR